MKTTFDEMLDNIDRLKEEARRNGSLHFQTEALALLLDVRKKYPDDSKEFDLVSEIFDLISNLEIE